MEIPGYWDHLSEEAHADRRKEKRVPLAFPIEISGFNKEGYFFRELSMTSDISESGCRFHVCHEMEKDGVVAIRVARKGALESGSDPTQLFRVAWARARDGGFIAGASKLQGESAWKVVFPQQAKAHTSFA